MKRTFITLALALATTFTSTLTGCGSPPKIVGAAPDFGQVAQQVCPIAQPFLASLSVLPFDPSVQVGLADAKVVTDAVCVVGATVTAGNLQTIAGKVLPPLIAAVNASGWSQNDKLIALVALAGAQASVTGALAMNPPLTSIGTGIAAPTSTAAK